MIGCGSSHLCSPFAGASRAHKSRFYTYRPVLFCRATSDFSTSNWYGCQGAGQARQSKHCLIAPILPLTAIWKRAESSLSARSCWSSIRHSRHSIGGFTLKPARQSPRATRPRLPCVSSLKVSWLRVYFLISREHSHCRSAAFSQSLMLFTPNDKSVS